MRVGIITFHWATNFGAVLQAYALQTYLRCCGCDVEIIDYKPYTYDIPLWRLLCSRNPCKNLCLWIKEKEIASFRKRYLMLTRRYSSQEQLRKTPPDFDIYITGSDQVWNPYFLTNGERKQTLTYFLDFGTKKVRKCAYAISCGVEKYDKMITQVLNSVVRHFACIGVREFSGLGIVDSLGFSGVKKLVPDPTLLLCKDDYDLLLSDVEYDDTFKKDYIYLYILRESKLLKYLCQEIEHGGFECVKAKPECGDVKKWLARIKHARFVVTNSYHGMLFCIQYHIPFLILMEHGLLQGMNDRFRTVLNIVGLENRVIRAIQINELKNFMADTIDWIEVDEKISKFRNTGRDFIRQNILQE